MRPDLSGMVIEQMTGTLRAPSSNASRIANSAALALRVSMWVSGKSRSTPPSISAIAWALNASTSSRNVTERKPGSLTSGDSEALLLVGPIEPATQRGLPSSATARSTARRAQAAAATLMVWTWSCRS